MTHHPRLQARRNSNAASEPQLVADSRRMGIGEHGLADARLLTVSSSESPGSTFPACLRRLESYTPAKNNTPNLATGVAPRQFLTITTSFPTPVWPANLPRMPRQSQRNWSRFWVHFSVGAVLGAGIGLRTHLWFGISLRQDFRFILFVVACAMVAGLIAGLLANTGWDRHL